MGRAALFSLILVVSISRCFSQDSIWLGRTTGKLSFMEYGIGDDRLGGAKMGYLDSNILVKITDSFNTDYKVRLSTYHSAYIAKTSVTLLSKQADIHIAHNTHLSGHMDVYGDAECDYVTINLDERLPYHSFQLLAPSRVAIDIFGVTSNTNWITQLRTTKEIKNTWHEQVEDDVLRIYIALKHDQHWEENV